MHRFPIVILAFGLLLPASADARPPKASEINSAVTGVVGEAAAAIDAAGAEYARAIETVELRERELVGARHRLEAARVRVNQEDVALKAVDLQLKAADAEQDLELKERLSADRVHVGQRHKWRVEERSAARRVVQLAQLRLAEARTESKLAETRWTREKLAAWVALGASPEVDTALAGASRKVGGMRRALERDQRRTARAEQKVATANAAVESLRPDDLEGRLAEAESRATALGSELEAAQADLEAERGGIDRLGVRLAEERDAAEADRTRVAELEDALAAAQTAAAAAAAEAARTSAEQDEKIGNLRAQLESKLGARPQDDLAELQGELDAVRGERDRLAVVAAVATDERAAQERRIAELENRAEEATRALAAERASRAGADRDEAHAAELAELRAMAAAAAAERDELQQSISGGDTDEAKVRTMQVDSLRRRLEAGEELHRRRVESLEAELADRSEALRATEERLARAHDEADQLAADLARRDAGSGAGQERVAALEKELAEAKQAVAARLVELSKVDGRDGTLAALRTEADELREQLVAAERNTIAAQATAEERALRLSELDAELARARARLAEETELALSARAKAEDSERARGAAQSQERAALQDRAEGAESRLVAAEAELNAGAARRSELQAEVASLKAALEEGGGADARIAELEGRVQDLGAERDEINEKLTDAQNFARLEMDVLRGQVEAFSEGIVEAESRIEEREARVAELTRALDAAETARRDSGDGLRAELRTVREESARRQAVVRDLEAQLREALRRVARLTSENKGLWSKIDSEMDWQEAEEGEVRAPAQQR